MVFQVVMYECTSCTIKKSENQGIDAFELWCWRRLLRVPWTARRSNQSIQRKSVLNIHWKDHAETPILWPPDVKNWLIGRDPDAGKDWRQEEKGMAEDEMVGWHHQLNRHEFEQALGVGHGQVSVTCYSPWGRKELYMTEWLNWLKQVNDICTNNQKRSKSWRRESDFSLTVLYVQISSVE